jgi:hypothetical protein
MKNRKRKLRNLPAALVLLLVLAAAHQVIAGEFLLFYANDVHGETEPCG